MIPTEGAFSWQTTGDESLIDSNSLLLLFEGEEFREGHPVADIGHGSLILSPSEELLNDAGLTMQRGRSMPARRTMPDHVRLLAHRLTSPRLSLIEREELLVALLHAAVAPRPDPVRRRSRLIEHAKEVMHAHVGENISLTDIAARVGASPVYLTQAFTRAEGMPLYKYHMRLRLGRALALLREEPDLTRLALDLGFSSHSHFTAAFRKAFGAPPSQIRAWW